LLAGALRAVPEELLLLPKLKSKAIIMELTPKHHDHDHHDHHHHDHDHHDHHHHHHHHHLIIYIDKKL
jgi:hypothetical protein